jgi:hypothetical protein
MIYTRNFVPCCLILGFTLCVPFAAKPAAILVNNTCEGTCSPGALSNGNSTSGGFNFDYTFSDGDVYDVSGSYSASYSNVTGSTIVVDPTFTYVGAAPSVGNDTLEFDLYQFYSDANCCTWAGTYSETVPLALSSATGPGSTISGQLLFDGQSVGLAGPFGPGNYLVSESADLDFGPKDSSPFLLADFAFTAQFDTGTTPGAGASGAPTPEPAMDLTCGLGLILFVCIARRRNRPRIAA